MSGGEILGPGVRVGRYVVLDELGSGAMGVVWAARDPELDRRVAIKLLRAPVSEARLVREARALAKLAHPNVVTVHDVGTFEGRPFVAMELVEGTTLRRWLEGQRRSWREALEVLVSAGRGLAAAHAAGLVHRDFKPDNVLIGNDGRVRVLDFGLVGEDVTPARAAAIDAALLDSAPARLTETGALIGTPAYMAPEQIRVEEADARTDQWSYCVTLWEAAYGERPFRGETLRELARAVTSGAIAAPPRDRAVPGWLRRALARGLSIDRDARFPSMDALLVATSEGLAGEDDAARLIGRRYERLTQSAQSSLAGGERVLDRLTGAVVTLVRAGGARDDEADTDARIHLTRALRRLASLRHPNLVAILDFGFDHGQAPYFVLDHHEAASSLPAPRDRSLRRDVERLVQILRALAYLHRHGVAHGAISPDAVLASGAEMKLVPLSAELLPERVQAAFVAPEIARGGRPSVAADLYSFGALAHEILAAHLQSVDLDSTIAEVLDRLTRDDPAARFASAEDVIAALAAATGRPLAADTAETQESFLQAAELAGRDEEVSRLHAALRDAIRGDGSAWLVGGESGVGKSRLLEELRTLALVHGALVLQGQEEREGGGPYHLFRGALRRLALISDLDELEAGVLLPIVPDLDKLLRRAVTPAPELDASSMHARLCSVVERVLRRQEQPMVLLLEDLQWSRSDGLKLLQGIYPLTRAIPLLVVATYRDDERRELPGELPGMEPIALSRLSETAIADLASSMIGDAGRRPEIVSLIHRETEGNAFFVVEVVRALAEEAGGLDRIGKAALPEKVFAGGIRRVVQRRLRRAPEDARALLRTAAVIGREVDCRLLEALSPVADLETWIERCVDCAVLERAGDGARFAHDKLREGLLSEMSEEEAKRLHAQVAAAIEALYPGAQERYSALAYHHRAAGDVAKEATYAALAGELSLLNGAWKEAQKLLERALALKSASSAEPPEAAHIHRQLEECYFVEMRFAEAHHHGVAAMAAAGCPLPRSRRSWPLFVLFQLFVQVLHLLFPGRGVTRSARRREELRAASRAASQLASVFTFDSDILGLVGTSLVAMNAAERAGGMNAHAAAVLGCCVGAAGLGGLSRAYFNRVKAWEPGPGELPMLLSAYSFEIVLPLGQARFEEVERLSRQLAARTTEVGDSQRTRYAECNFGVVALYRGDLEEARYWCARCVDELDASLARHAVFFTMLEAPVLYALGRADEAHDRLHAARSSFSTLDHGTEACWWGAVALVEVGRGQVEAAIEAADNALGRLKSLAGLAPYGGVLLVGAMSAYLAGWERASKSGSDARTMIRRARHALRMSLAWSRTNPIGRPQALLDRGRVELLSGRADRARRSWREALALSTKLGFLLHEGLAHLELGRASPGGSAERASHLAEARSRFHAAGARQLSTQVDAEGPPTLGA